MFIIFFLGKQLEFDHFLDVMGKVQRWGDTPDEILDAFMTFDENRNGKTHCYCYYLGVFMMSKYFFY